MSSNADVVMNYLDAARRGDTNAMRESFTSDFVYRVPGRGPLSGTTTGQSAALDYFATIMQLTNGTYAMSEVVDVLSSTDRVALIARETAERNGRRVEWTRVVVFSFRDGLISEAALFDDALYELDALLRAPAEGSPS